MADDSFSKIDVDGDNILSFREVVHFIEVAAFISPYAMEFMYDANIKNIYNHTDLFGPLWFQYAANIFFNSYKDGGAPMTGYITKDVFFDHYSVGKMNVYDDNGDNVVDFDEFTLHFFGNSTVNLIQTVSNYYHDLDILPYQSQDYDTLLDMSNVTTIEEIELLIFPSTIEEPSSSQSSRRRLFYENCFHEYCAAEGTYSLAICYNGEGYGTCLQDVDQECYDEYCLSCQYRACPRSAGTEYSVSRSQNANPTPKPTIKPTCYGGSNQMLVNREDTISEMSLRDLEIGDFVQSKDAEWTKIWYIQEYDAQNATVIDLYFDYNQTPLSLTDDHLLYVDGIMDEHLKRADDIRIGDVLLVMSDKGIFDRKIVIDIGQSVETYLSAPITMDGSIVVSKVLGSSYFESIENKQKWHESAASFRGITKINTKLAAMIADFGYNVLFKMIRPLGVEYILNSYSAPIIFCVLSAIMTIFMIKIVHFVFWTKIEE